MDFPFGILLGYTSNIKIPIRILHIVLLKNFKLKNVFIITYNEVCMYTLTNSSKWEGVNCLSSPKIANNSLVNIT